MAGIEISRALHLLGVIFWVGGLGPDSFSSALSGRGPTR